MCWDISAVCCAVPGVCRVPPLALAVLFEMVTHIPQEVGNTCTRVCTQISVDPCSLWPWVCLLLLSVTKGWDVPGQQPLGSQSECRCLLTSPRSVPYIHSLIRFSRPWLPQEQISVESRVSGRRDTQRKSLPITSLSTTPRTAQRQHAGWRRTSSAPKVRGFVNTHTYRNAF